jgi:hypothetical protein
MIGVGEIELPVTALAATRPIAVLVDLTDVSFLASVGLRCIIQSAKTQDLKGGRMALLVGDNPLVRQGRAFVIDPCRDAASLSCQRSALDGRSALRPARRRSAVRSRRAPG